ncbi:unnamed protein product, partial [Brassica rapa]
AVCVCPCVSVSIHRTSMAVHQCTYQHAGPWTQHAGPSMDCSGDFWPTWAVGSVHTGRPTHRTSVPVHQYTYQQVGPWTQHADPSRGLFG